MKGIVVTTDNKAEIVDFGNSTEEFLPNIHATIGGYMEVVRLSKGSGLVMIVNEEGKLLDLPPNKFGSSLYLHDIIVGNIVLINEGIINDIGERDFIGFKDDEAEHLLAVINKLMLGEYK